MSSKQVTHTVRVEFGDCDPARIVWFPNFFRWIDAAARQFFTACGVPSWKDTEKSLGMLGTPLVNTEAKFIKTASYGDVLAINVSVAQWREKSFVLRYRVLRDKPGDSEPDLIMECEEVRIFAGRCPDDPEAIRALPIPAEIRRLCE